MTSCLAPYVFAVLVSHSTLLCLCMVNTEDSCFSFTL